ncbi:MAG: sugar phosphate isomerase/epimerase [Planctomycetes bacterium]|nr:sugar phosphate isomerase/epimerase [Planctomycetota bacterium]
MARPVTLFTGQWADLELEVLCEKAKSWGYEGLELACWGDHFEVDKAMSDPGYCDAKRKLLAKHGLKCFAISCHLAGQLVCDRIDHRHAGFVPDKSLHGDPEKMRAWAIEMMKDTARAAQKFGVGVVNGFTGSSIWPYLYSFPPVSEEEIERGFQDFADRWNPIFDVFGQCGVKFALEVHPTEIAFDTITAKRALEKVGRRPEFGFNFDPSHLQWQGCDPAEFIREFPDRIYHVHMKDCSVTLNGKGGILGSHLNFGSPGRGWDFRSLGRGDVDFEEVIRALNEIGYRGPLSVEWEDSGMDREQGAAEACEFVRRTDFTPSKIAFDAAFDR